MKMVGSAADSLWQMLPAQLWSVAICRRSHSDCTVVCRGQICRIFGILLTRFAVWLTPATEVFNGVVHTSVR